jgi:tripartite-type tricarboxylate transporter receptor subunit TctC
MLRKPAMSAPLAAVALALAASAAAAQSDEAAQFYSGKTVNIIVSVEVGGLYSTIGTIIARHMGAHIPGRPNVIVQHMPGAGGSIAANYAYNIAPKDGTVVLTPNAGLHLRVALGLDKPTYEAARFTWIGGWGEGINTVTLRRDIAPVKSLEEARKTEAILGAIGKASNTFLVPALMNNMLGTRFKIITGYRGGAPIRLAMEKGEVHGWAGQWDGWKLLNHAWVRDGNLVHLVQLGSKPTPDLPDVPLLSSFARSDDERTILKVIESGIADRAMLVPPGVPPARVKALQAAFQAMLHTPQFVADAKTAQFDIEPIGGETIQAFVAGIAALPPATVSRIRKAMELE